MVRGKKPCELGRDCPYKHEYQHNLEFSHPDNSAGASSAAGAKTKRFEGTARKLGGTSSRPHRPVPNQPERKKPRLMAARRAAADAALRRAGDVQTGTKPTSVSAASSSSGPLLPLAATTQRNNHQGTRPRNAAVANRHDATRLIPMQGSSQRASASGTVASQPKKKAPMTREPSSNDVIDLTGFD